MKFDFKGKNVIVTGGASGLGQCIAEQFAAAGANVVIVDTNVEKSTETAKSLLKYGTTIKAIPVDITKYELVEKLAEKVNEELGSIDILINSAGICKMGNITDMDINTLDAVIDVDYKGTVYCSKAVLPYMKEKQFGKIVNMSSIAAKLSGTGMSIYSSVKMAIISLTAALGREYAKDGINVNAVLPGIIRTNMWEGMLDDMTNNAEMETKNEVFGQYEDSIPQGKAQEPIDIANMTLYLCTEEAKCITGQNIGVDGGHTF